MGERKVYFCDSCGRETKGNDDRLYKHWSILQSGAKVTIEPPMGPYAGWCYACLMKRVKETLAKLYDGVVKDK